MTYKFLFCFFALTTSTFGAPGDIYVANSGTNQIVKVAGGVVSVSSYTQKPLAIAFDGKGNEYVVCINTDVIYKIDKEGNQTVFTTNINNAQNIVINSDGELYVGELAGNVYKFTTNGQKTLFASGFNLILGLTFKGTDLYVSENGNGKITKIQKDGSKSTFATDLRSPHGIVFDSTGNLYVCDAGIEGVVKIAPDGTKSTFATIPRSGPTYIAIDKDSNLYVSCITNVTNQDFVARVAPNGTWTTYLSSMNLPQGIAIEPTPHALLNISTRALVQGGSNALIAGFIVGGNGAANSTVVVRALGPSLTAFGVAGALQDPLLEVHDANGTLAINNDWKDTQQAAIAATGLAPTNDKESAILITLGAGPYTAVVKGNGGTQGVALVDAYILD